MSWIDNNGGYEKNVLYVTADHDHYLTLLPHFPEVVANMIIDGMSHNITPESNTQVVSHRAICSDDWWYVFANDCSGSVALYSNSVNFILLFSIRTRGLRLFWQGAIMTTACLKRNTWRTFLHGRWVALDSVSSSLFFVNNCLIAYTIAIPSCSGWRGSKRGALLRTTWIGRKRVGESFDTPDRYSSWWWWRMPWSPCWQRISRSWAWSRGSCS